MSVQPDLWPRTDHHRPVPDLGGETEDGKREETKVEKDQREGKSCEQRERKRERQRNNSKEREQKRE